MPELAIARNAVSHPDDNRFADPADRASVRHGIYAVAVVLLAIGWSGDFPLDDAYITMHNARALLRGWDGTYGVSPLVGATSLVHLALMAALGLIMPLPYAAMTICLAAALAYAVGLDRLVRRAGTGGWQALVLTLAGLLAGTLPTLMANGLETGLACAAVTWLLLLDRRLPLLAGIAPFIRPELAILAGLAMVRTLHGASHARRLRAMAWALAGALPFAAWSWLETGHVVPATMAAKLAFFREADWTSAPRMLALRDGLVNSGLIVLIPGLAGLRDWRGWGFLAPVLLFLWFLLPGAFTWNAARYLGPLARSSFWDTRRRARPA